MSYSAQLESSRWAWKDIASAYRNFRFSIRSEDLLKEYCSQLVADSNTMLPGYATTRSGQYRDFGLNDAAAAGRESIFSAGQRSIWDESVS